MTYRKALIVILLCFVSCALFASDFWLVNTDFKTALSYGSDFEFWGVTLGSHSHFRDTDHRIGAEITVWLVDREGYKTYRVAELNFNYHYIIYESKMLKIYPLASAGYHLYYEEWRHPREIGGVTFTDRDRSGFGAGVGGGIELELPRVHEFQRIPLRLFAEPRYFFMGNEQLQITVGVYARFPGF